MHSTRLNDLLAIGFEDVGAWQILRPGGPLDYVVDGPNIVCNKALMIARKSLYAFVQNVDVLYVGKTTRTLRERLSGYQNPGGTQRTNLRCNAKIREELEKGNSVRILVLVTAGQLSKLQFGDFSINLAAGLEDSIIEKLNPPWNGRDRMGALTEQAEREQSETSRAMAHLQDGIETGQPVPSRVVLPVSGPAIVSFQIRLGEAYYNKGIINPGANASLHLGAHGDSITILLGDPKTSLVSRIDRVANPGGSVRIVGANNQIAQWFRDNFSFGEVVEARVLDLNRIWLLPHHV